MSWTGWGDRERQGDGKKNTAIARYIFLCMHWGGNASAQRVGQLCLGSGQLPVDIVSSGVSCQWWIDKSTPHTFHLRPDTSKPLPPFFNSSTPSTSLLLSSQTCLVGTFQRSGSEPPPWWWAVLEHTYSCVTCYTSVSSSHFWIANSIWWRTCCAFFVQCTWRLIHLELFVSCERWAEANWAMDSNVFIGLILENICVGCLRWIFVNTFVCENDWILLFYTPNICVGWVFLIYMTLGKNK